MTEEELVSKHKDIFRLWNKSGCREPISLFGIEAPSAWYELIDKLCTELEPYGVTCYQCKSKFGSLRFYIDKYSEEINAILNKYESLSAVTCEVCGGVGVIKNDNGWLTVLCDEHIK